MLIIFSLSLILVACLVIWKASDGFETASEYLGRHLSEGVRGATINAIGSSVPEIFTTMFFLLILHDQEGFAGGIGTTAGSAIFNAMIIPAAVILVVILVGKVKFVKVSKKVIFRDGIMLLLSEFILIYLLAGGVLDWWHGLILMLIYIVYVIVMFATMNKTNIPTHYESKDDNNTVNTKRRSVAGHLMRLDLEGFLVGKKELTTIRAWRLLLVSTCVIGVASAVLVVACEQMGIALDMPVYFVAVILAAAATSVPDTILSIKDAQKGNYDDAVSNALGSNIFDICFALGFPLFLYTLFFQPIHMGGLLLENVNELRILLLLLTTVVFLIFILSKRLKILQALLLLAVYVFFTLFIIGKSLDVTWIDSLSHVLYQISQLVA